MSFIAEDFYGVVGNNSFILDGILYLTLQAYKYANKFLISRCSVLSFLNSFAVVKVTFIYAQLINSQ